MGRGAWWAAGVSLVVGPWGCKQSDTTFRLYHHHSEQRLPQALCGTGMESG